MEIKKLQTKTKEELIEIIKGLEVVIKDMALNVAFIKRQNTGVALG